MRQQLISVGNKVLYKLGFDGTACARLQSLTRQELGLLVTELERLAPVVDMTARIRGAVQMLPLRSDGSGSGSGSDGKCV